jgi:hypothetical protein
MDDTNATNITNLELFLEAEKHSNVGQPWCKLNKTYKIKKMIDFVEIYKKENKLTDSEGESLIVFLKDALDKKKLFRVKDVVYDKTTGTIKKIPALTFTKQTGRFTLKNLDKRVSTLKSLTPKTTKENS